MPRRPTPRSWRPKPSDTSIFQVWRCGCDNESDTQILSDNQRKHFAPDGRLARLEPFFEAMEKVFFGSADVTAAGPTRATA
jgi:hypothetical protein